MLRRLRKFCYDHSKLLAVFVGNALFCGCFIGLLVLWGRCQDPNAFEISADSGFYENEITVSLRIRRAGTVYYSINGEEPVEYGAPLALSAGEHGRCYEISFFGLDEEGGRGEDVTRIYYLFPEEKGSCETDYIVCVWGDEEAMFSYEEGIFVRGRQFDTFLSENPDVSIYGGLIIPANYNSNRELPVRSLILDKNGQCISGLNCGLRIYGGMTRAKNQKSFRLTARYAYDGVNSFDHPFFPRLTNETNGVIDSFKKLSFHNSGDDNGYGFIRNQLCNQLAGEAGFPDVLNSKSAAVYVNDRYLGVYWMQNAYDAKYFEEKYHFTSGEMVVLEGVMSKVRPAEGKEEELQAYADEYNTFCEWLADRDIRKPDVWERVTGTIDVENFLQYAAIEYYVSNLDWPYNNVKTYRYVEPGGAYTPDSVFDGRYRFLLYDLDYGMGLFCYGFWGVDARTPRLYTLCGSSAVPQAALFSKLMTRVDCQRMFITNVLDLLNGSFAPDNVERTLRELNDTRWRELTYMMEETDILKGSLWESDDNGIADVEECLEGILTFARERPDFVMEEMSERWHTGSGVRLLFDISDDIRVLVNNVSCGPDSSCVYFADIPIHLAVQANAGVQTEGYYINDCYVEGEEVSVLLANYAEDGLVVIRPAAEEQVCEKIAIKALRTRGTQDYVTLENTGNTKVSLRKYYLSDTEANLFKWQLADIELLPGEEVTFYGEKYDREAIDELYRCPFSWNEEESVFLSSAQNGLVEAR